MFMYVTHPRLLQNPYTSQLNPIPQKHRKLPDQDPHTLTPATRLLEKRREMLEVENGLKHQKDEFEMKMEALAQRREELARKEQQLRESLNKFDKALKVGVVTCG